MHFTDWVKANIITQPGSFITNKRLYEEYERATESPARVSEDKFYKEIEPVMFGLHIKPGRFKDKMGRGFQFIPLLPQNTKDFVS